MRTTYLKIFLLLLLLVSIVGPGSLAQVGEVNENIEKSKKKSNTKLKSGQSTSESSGGGGFIVFLGEVFIHTIGAAQIAALENKHIYPERVGINAGVDLGSGFIRNTWNITTKARFNWGLFASDFKYNSLADISGQLNTIDWQVIILRIPIQSFNLEYGYGFISVPNQSQSYGSNVVGFDFKIRPIGMTFSSHYYWSSITSLQTRFRKSFEVSADYELVSRNKFHLAALSRYSFQQYFEETDFSIVSLGLVMKIY